jgi:YggT family protein
LIILANFLAGLAYVLQSLLSFMIVVVIARAIISWVNPDPYNPIVRFLASATDPILYRIKRYLPLQVGVLDFAPLILLFALMFLQYFLVGTLQDYARQIKISSYQSLQSRSNADSPVPFKE